MRFIFVFALVAFAVALVSGRKISEPLDENDKELVLNKCGNCPDTIDPVCAKNTDGTRLEFDNECRMWIYNCIHRERFLPDFFGRCDSKGN